MLLMMRGSSGLVQPPGPPRSGLQRGRGVVRPGLQVASRRRMEWGAGGAVGSSLQRVIRSRKGCPRKAWSSRSDGSRPARPAPVRCVHQGPTASSTGGAPVAASRGAAAPRAGGGGAEAPAQEEAGQAGRAQGGGSPWRRATCSGPGRRALPNGASAPRLRWPGVAHQRPAGVCGQHRGVGGSGQEGRDPARREEGALEGPGRWGRAGAECSSSSPADGVKGPCPALAHPGGGAPPGPRVAPRRAEPARGGRALEGGGRVPPAPRGQVGGGGGGWSRAKRTETCGRRPGQGRPHPAVPPGRDRSRAGLRRPQARLREGGRAGASAGWAGRLDGGVPRRLWLTRHPKSMPRGPPLWDGAAGQGLLPFGAGRGFGRGSGRVKIVIAGRADAQDLQTLGGAHPEVELVTAPAHGAPLLAALEDAEGLYIHTVTDEMYRGAPLRWVQSQGAGGGVAGRGPGLPGQRRGVDQHPRGPRPHHRGARLRRCCPSPCLPELRAAQADHAWRKPSRPVGLSGLTCGVVGLGNIGTAIARRAHGFEMVIAVDANEVPRPEFVERSTAWRACRPSCGRRTWWRWRPPHRRDAGPPGDPEPPCAPGALPARRLPGALTRGPGGGPARRGAWRGPGWTWPRRSPSRRRAPCGTPPTCS